jgi:DNA-binding response OmpR family regulator
VGRPLKVLMIEDSDDDAHLIAGELRHGGFDVEYSRVDTSSVLEDALTKDTWDIILCDHAMPKLCAPEAVSILRKNKIKTPVIIVSGWITKDLAKVTIEAGANDYVSKNELHKLVGVIDKELGNSRGRKASKKK